jgi:hypothetical protein
MTWQARAKLSWSALAAILTFAVVLCAREKASRPHFKYVGGTEDVVYGCGGSVQLTTASLTFRCDQRTVAIPYVAVSVMQYRPDISKKVRKMDLNWKLRPPHGGGKKNRYFTIVYSEDGTSHAVILEVAPDAMRPYLAEIDLKSGKRVEVRGYESYD